ncbi:MAG: 2-isopropylmalate synthase, partial [Halobacteria archaeon]
MAARKIAVFDTTLRDGEQAPGVTFSVEQKVAVARQLSKLGVDFVEAGTPISSKGEKEAVGAVCREGRVRGGAKIAGLARIDTGDIDAALDCGVDMVHVFTPTSDIQVKHTVKLTREAILEKASECVEYVKDHGALCLFSAMDATRTPADYVVKIFRAVERAGADVVNIPDTVGVAVPETMEALARRVSRAVKIPVDVHCHNDYGLAGANTLAAVRAGASQVQVTVNGIGERGGNADLAQVVMALHTIYRHKTRVRTQHLVETSKLLERFTSFRVLPNTPVVGANAFSHKSGIHQHGVLGDPRTFEPGIMTPEMVGHHRTIALGKLSGKHGVAKKVQDMGFDMSPSQQREILAKVKELGDRGRDVTDADLHTIAETVLGKVPPEKRALVLEEVSVTTGNRVTPRAAVRAKLQGRMVAATAGGVGPVDAAFAAIKKAAGNLDIAITDFRIDAITGGSDALADVTVGVADKRGHSVMARGVADDIVMASVEALVSAINRLLSRR